MERAPQVTAKAPRTWPATLALSVVLCVACHRSRKEAPPRPTVPVAVPLPAAPVASAGASPRPSGALREVTWHFDSTPFGASEVVVAIPTDGAPDARWPVLVAFHGRGESLRGAKRGARGWIDDYTLPKTTRRLSAPPLTGDDMLGMVTEAHLADLNGALSAVPFRGLIVVCPFLPDVLRGGRGEADGKQLARFIVEEVLPRVYRETPAIGTAASTGVDGVSLGGRAALFVGLERPEAFGAVGALQPALDSEEAVRFSQLAEDARTKNPALALRLLTSDEDYFLEPTQVLSKALTAHGVPHRLDVVSGTHSYEFNRGPGGYEMLLFHDRALRSAPVPALAPAPSSSAG
jgi:enterochelin esterase-like enzyme